MQLYFVEGADSIRFYTYTTTPDERARIKLHFASKGWGENPFTEDEGDFSTVGYPELTLRVAGALLKAINGPIRFLNRR